MKITLEHRGCVKANAVEDCWPLMVSVQTQEGLDEVLHIFKCPLCEVEVQVVFELNKKDKKEVVEQWLTQSKSGR